MEVHEWFKDGHKVRVILDGESTRLDVICPGLESGYRPDLKCGLGADEKGNPLGPFCWVKEMIRELGMEAHCSGLGIIISGDMPIEWGYYGSDGEEFWFKCAGYPSYEEAKKFKTEAIEELFPDSINSIPSMRIPAEMLPLLPLRPWAEVDEETKEGLRETLCLHLENEERRRRKNDSRTKA